MLIKKQNGEMQELSFDKILKRLENSYMTVVKSGKNPILLDLDYTKLAQEVIAGLYDGVSTQEIDTWLASSAAKWAVYDPFWDAVAVHIEVTRMHKYVEYNPQRMLLENITTQAFTDAVYSHWLWDCLEYERDFNFDYFGLKTLQSKYLKRYNDGTLAETPQHLYMRIACSLFSESQEVKTCYDALSLHHYTHASPTMFNAGTPDGQLASCFLVANKDDSLLGIYDTIKDTALISKNSGGIGFHIHDVRANGSPIKTTGGKSDGIIPMLRVYNNTARYCNQGGGKRKGAFAAYLEPWHADVEDFLDLRYKTGDVERRCLDLFTALWVSDLFMKQVAADGDWHLFDPAKAPGLADVYGEAFDELYEQYVVERRFTKVIKARDLMQKILHSMLETGTPYILYKDACNRLHPHNQLGTIKSSNLCAEVIQYSSSEHTAVCHLASINLVKMMDGRILNIQRLRSTVKLMVRALNQVIDTTTYPTPEAERSSKETRSIGIGIQGFADVLSIQGGGFERGLASQMNKIVSQEIYSAALGASKELFEEGTKPELESLAVMQRANSLMIAYMPTASTSQILGNTESFEPRTSNVYLRSTLAGDFEVVNKYLVKDLNELGLWSKEMVAKIIAERGSVQNIKEIPEAIRRRYKTVWEIDPYRLLDLAAVRQRWTCQSQSMNLYLNQPDMKLLYKLLHYGWQSGLRTGSYYTRTQPASNAVSFVTQVNTQSQACSIDDESCDSCSG